MDAFVRILEHADINNITEFDPLTWHSCAQLPHLLDKKGNLMVDFIGRFERLEEDFKCLSQCIGIQYASLPHTKQSDRKDYREYYTDALRDRVAALYKDDIEYFDYSF